MNRLPSAQKRPLLLLPVLLLFPALTSRADDAAGPKRHELTDAPAPPDNPLKGLVPYAGQGRDRFPHSMEFNYLPLADLVVGRDTYDWEPLERLLNEIADRGHQAVFRIFLEYPNRKNVIPRWLVDEGLTVHRYVYTNTQPFKPAPIETPDYEDPRLRAMLRQFILAMGERYDGDPRIGAITAGLLGTWGEWHTYPRSELFASPAVQAEVMDAYTEAFSTTPILLRYPAGPDEEGHARNDNRPFGYHDDSFAWATLDSGRKGDDWFFMNLMKKAGPGTLDRWKTHPIGGEIRPEAWGLVFDADPGTAQIQDFRSCVEQTHVTWLMDTGMFRGDQPEGRVERAINLVRSMGYEFHVPAVTIDDTAEPFLTVEVELQNRGVAPFYADWFAEFGFLNSEGTLAATRPASGKLSGLLPGEPPRVWRDRLDLAELPAGSYQLLLRVPNPLPNGTPVRFANAEQDRDRDGWLTLGRVTIARP